jgi:hypothetical protein
MAGWDYGRIAGWNLTNLRNRASALDGIRSGTPGSDDVRLMGDSDSSAAEQLVHLVPRLGLLGLGRRAGGHRFCVGVGVASEGCPSGGRRVSRWPNRSSGVAKRLRALAENSTERFEHPVCNATGGQEPVFHLVVVRRDLVGSVSDAERFGELSHELASLEPDLAAQARQQGRPQASLASDDTLQLVDHSLG